MELKLISEKDHLLSILKMKPSDRLKKCFELSEWSNKLNQYHEEEIARRTKGFFILK